MIVAVRSAAPKEDSLIIDIDEGIGVVSDTLVRRVLNRLGGATLFSHSVVPFTTEK